MKINGWKRIGIVASVAWVLGAGIHTLNTENDRDMEIGSAMNRHCFDDFASHGESAGYEGCLKVGYNFTMRMLPIEREDAALVALVPIPFGWGAAYLLLFLARWIRRGVALH